MTVISDIKRMNDLYYPLNFWNIIDKNKSSCNKVIQLLWTTHEETIQGMQTVYISSNPRVMVLISTDMLIIHYKNIQRCLIIRKQVEITLFKFQIECRVTYLGSSTDGAKLRSVIFIEMGNKS